MELLSLLDELSRNARCAAAATSSWTPANAARRATSRPHDDVFLREGARQRYLFPVPLLLDFTPAGASTFDGIPLLPIPSIPAEQ